MKDHLAYWKEMIEQVVMDYENRDEEISRIYEEKNEQLFDDMYKCIDKMKRPDSELLNLNEQSRNTKDPRVKQRIESEIDKKMDKLKEQRLKEFKNLVNLEKERLKKKYNKEVDALKAEAENKLTQMDAKQKSEFTKLTNRYKNIRIKLEKSHFKENSIVRELQKQQNTRNRYQEEMATKKLDFRNDEHEFFK